MERKAPAPASAPMSHACVGRIYSSWGWAKRAFCTAVRSIEAEEVRLLQIWRPVQPVMAMWWPPSPRATRDEDLVGDELLRGLDVEIALRAAVLLRNRLEHDERIELLAGRRMLAVALEEAFAFAAAEPVEQPPIDEGSSSGATIW